jgi:small subunit ribosomal protein S13
MPRILGVDIPNEKRIEVALQYLYGIGEHRAKEILKEVGIDPNVRAKTLKDDEVARIAAFIDKKYNDETASGGRAGPVEGALRRRTMQAISRLKKIGCYRGTRHIRSLPARGQRTRTNGRTRKGKKKTVAVKRSVKEMR